MSDWKNVPSKASQKETGIEAWIMLKDPLVARMNGIGLQKILIENETTVGKGPTSSRIAVVDFDITHDTVFAGAKLAKTGTKFTTKFKLDDDRLSDGNCVLDLTEKEVKKLEADFHFHQVNVWATIHRTMDLIEKPDILGRQIPWAFDEGRIKILPHACYDENAYYDRDSGAICFGYFFFKPEDCETSDEKMVFTCLSHDVITHELGHAILDGLKPYYNEFTSAATAGFHEYFGDAIAMTSLLANRHLVVQVAGRENGLMSQKSLFSHIAQELGHGLDSSTDYLRTATNDKKVGDMSEDQMNSEHDYSEILTGAYFDLLIKIYRYRIYVGKGTDANDRVAALINAAKVTRRMMLRALDYCPPVDLNFHDYAQAVYRSDLAAHPQEPNVYRDFWAEVCINRQISRNRDDLAPQTLLSNKVLRRLNIEKLASSKTDAYEFIDANREVLEVPKTANLKVINLYRTNKISSNDFRVPQEVIIEFVWISEVKLDGDRDDYGALLNQHVNLWCGGTIVFSREGNILHYTVKKEDKKRKKDLKKYTKFLIKEGYLGVEGTEKGLGANMTKRVSAKITDGKVSLTRNASMRCKSKCGKKH